MFLVLIKGTPAINALFLHSGHNRANIIVRNIKAESIAAAWVKEVQSLVLRVNYL